MPTIIYQGIELTQIESKEGGKNQNAINGFYKDEKSGKEFFIKKPDDPVEFFTELFAGKFVKKILERYIDPIYHASFICADYGTVVVNGKPEFVLVQPRASFEDGYKVLETGNTTATGLFNQLKSFMGVAPANADRSAGYEAAYGKEAYQKFLVVGPDGRHLGLDVILLISLLIADYSVHSGNVAVSKEHELYEGTPFARFIRYDLGAAGRGIGKSPKDVMQSPDQVGWSFKAWWSSALKDYIGNYTSIAGLFELIQQDARDLKSILTQEELASLCMEVIKEIPTNLIQDQKLAKKIADHLQIPAGTFMSAFNGIGEADEAFAKKWTEITLERLNGVIDIKVSTPKIDPESKDQQVYKNFPDIKPIRRSQRVAAESHGKAERRDSNDEPVTTMTGSYLDHIVAAEKHEQDSSTVVPEIRDEKVTIGVGELRGLKEKESENTMFMLYAANDFFEKGQGDFGQIERDYYERQYRIAGHLHLGLSGEQKAAFIKMDSKQKEGVILRQIARLLRKPNQTAEDAEENNIQEAKDIVSANSQGPDGLTGIVTYDLSHKAMFENLDFSVQMPTTGKVVDLIRSSDGKIRQLIYIEKYPIVSSRGRKAETTGYLPGPFYASYVLAKKNNKWGFQLEYIKASPDVANIIKRTTQFEPEELKEFKARYSTQSMQLPELPHVRRSPGAMAAMNIGRFFEKPDIYTFQNVVKSVQLRDRQNISNDGVFYNFIDKTENSFHVFYGVCDSDNIHKDVISLNHALAIYAEVAKTHQDGKKHTLVLPLATDQLSRKHWMPLIIEVQPNGEVTATLKDSQPWICRLYPTSYIETAIKKTFGSHAKFITSYLGDQRLDNFVDCGDWMIENSDVDLGFKTTRAKTINNQLLHNHKALIAKYRSDKSECLIPTGIPADPPQSLQHEIASISVSASIKKENELQSEFVRVEPLLYSDDELCISDYAEDIWQSNLLARSLIDEEALHAEAEKIAESKKVVEGHVQAEPVRSIVETPEAKQKAEAQYKGFVESRRKLQETLSQPKPQREPGKLKAFIPKKWEDKRKEAGKNWASVSQLHVTQEQEEKRKRLAELVKERKEREEWQKAQELKAAAKLKAPVAAASQPSVDANVKSSNISPEISNPSGKIDLSVSSPAVDVKAPEKPKEAEPVNVKPAVSPSVEPMPPSSVVNSQVVPGESREPKEPGQPKEPIKVEPPVSSPVNENPLLQEPMTHSHRGKRVGGAVGLAIGVLFGVVPFILIGMGVIFLPFTLGGSAALIGVGIGLLVAGALVGTSVGVGVGAAYDHRQDHLHRGSTHRIHAEVNKNGMGKPAPTNDVEVPRPKVVVESKTTFSPGQFAGTPPQSPWPPVKGSELPKVKKQ